VHWSEILSIISICISLVAAWFTYQQSDQAKRKDHRDQEQQRELKEWRDKFNRVASKITELNPPYRLITIKSHQEEKYPAVFNDGELRKQIEIHIVELTGTPPKLLPRKPSDSELGSTALRQAVEAAIIALREARRNPDLARFVPDIDQ
jgi:hypothetical protein